MAFLKNKPTATKKKKTAAPKKSSPTKAKTTDKAKPKQSVKKPTAKVGAAKKTNEPQVWRKPVGIELTATAKSKADADKAFEKGMTMLVKALKGHCDPDTLFDEEKSYV